MAAIKLAYHPLFKTQDHSIVNFRARFCSPPCGEHTPSLPAPRVEAQVDRWGYFLLGSYYSKSLEWWWGGRGGVGRGQAVCWDSGRKYRRRVRGDTGVAWGTGMHIKGSSIWLFYTYYTPGMGWP